MLFVTPPGKLGPLGSPCGWFRRDQLLNAQSRLRHALHRPLGLSLVMEEGLSRRAEFRMTPVFLKTVVMARDPDELAFKEERKGCAAYIMRRAASTYQRLLKKPWAKAQEHGLRGWPDHPMSWDRKVGAAPSCVTAACLRQLSKMSPLTFLKDVRSRPGGKKGLRYME
jgi:hypothetical protein